LLELQGHAVATTLMRTELMAVIIAMEALKRPCAVTVYTGRAMLKGAGMTSKSQRESANADLWERLRSAAASHKISWCEADRFCWQSQEVYRAAIDGLKLALMEEREGLDAAQRAAMRQREARITALIEGESEKEVNVIEVDFRRRAGEDRR
jgi:ribonuclease HI